VSDEDQRGARRAVEVEEQVFHSLGGLGVEVAGRLVGKQDPGLVDERPGHGHPLALPARELRRVVVEPVAEAHLAEEI